MEYAELHCISSFSFLRGASQPHELVRRAHDLGYAAIAITDECTMSGMVRAHVAARDVEMHLIAGCEFVLDDGERVVVLATSLAGYGDLCELITLGRSRAPKGEYSLCRADFCASLDECLLLIIPDDYTNVDDIRWWRTHFSERCWIAVELLHGPDDSAWLARLSEYSQCTGVPLVAAGGVHMHEEERKSLQDVMTAIRLGRTVDALGWDALPNAERHLRHRSVLANKYPSGLLAESVRIATLCRFSMSELRYRYPQEFLPPNETAVSYLRRLVDHGSLIRYPGGVPDKVRKLLIKELELIVEKEFESFFLTVYEIVEFAKSKNILCQGRGSAANSAVCYCLGITEVDPDQTEVLFERFISRERNEEPDIDVDFEHQRREEVIQFIYERYGRDRTAFTEVVIMYRRRSALRDVGKALGLSIDQVNRLTSTLAWWDRASDMAARLVEAGFDPANIRIQHIMHFTELLRGFPRHLSQHVGGFVIAEKKLSRMVPIQKAAMPLRSVVEWDKYDLEALGFLKVDVLALGMLTAIRKTFDALSDYEGIPRDRGMTLASIPKHDQATYDMICKADTVGVFQIESRAQMSMLPRLKPRTYYDLVIEVAIVRPGPIQGGMVHPYLRRRNNEEPQDCPAALLPVLSRTCGVPIFQEQVMKIAEIAADFTPGEADMLRRAMATWKQTGTLEPFRKKLHEGMTRNGYTPEYIERIYNQIQGFGEYGFPESHAAGFALLAYFSSWLKCHHPAAFTCGLLNSQPMGFYPASQLIQDLRRHDVTVLPVDVTMSGHASTLEKVNGSAALRLGMHLVDGLEVNAARRIENARAQKPFANIEDLAGRAALDAPTLDRLAAADALQALGGHRRLARWQTLGLKRGNALLPPVQGDGITPHLEPLEEGPSIQADYETTGLTLRRHPLALLRPKLKGHTPATNLANIRNGTSVRTTGLVTCRQRPGTASGVVFVTLEDETGNINVVLWSRLAEKYRRELLGSRLLTVHGKLERREGVTHVIAERLFDSSRLLGSLEVFARNFH